MAKPQAKFRVREAAVAVTVKPRIDTEKGVVYDCKILGWKSQNRNRYVPAELEKNGTARVLEGASVFLNHNYSKDESGQPVPRKIEDEFGQPKGVYFKPDGYYAREFHYDTLHPFAPRFEKRVKQGAKGIGFSIDADGLGYVDEDGTRVVEQLKRVHSIDLVWNPATNHSLFEQAMDPLTDPAAANVTDPAMDAPAEGGDHKQQLVEAAQAVAAELGEGSMDLPTAKKKLMAILSLIDDGDGEAEPSEGDSDTEESPVKEQVTRLTEQVQGLTAKLDKLLTAKPKPAGEKPRSAAPDPVKLKEQALPKSEVKSLAAKYYGDEDDD